MVENRDPDAEKFLKELIGLINQFATTEYKEPLNELRRYCCNVLVGNLNLDPSYLEKMRPLILSDYLLRLRHQPLRMILQLELALQSPTICKTLEELYELLSNSERYVYGETLPTILQAEAFLLKLPPLGTSA